MQQEKEPIESEVLGKTVDTITDKPIEFTFTVRLNRWQKLFKVSDKRTYQVHALTLGTAMRISKEVLKIDFNIDDVQHPERGYEAYADHAEQMARVVAMAVTNRKKPPSESMVSELLENLTAKEMFKLFSAVIQQMELQNFILSIAFIRQINILNQEASPMNQREGIASGEQWAAL